MIWPLPRWTIAWTCWACGTRSRDYPVPLLAPLWPLVELARDGWRHDGTGGRLCRACGDAKGIPGEIHSAVELLGIEEQPL